MTIVTHSFNDSPINQLAEDTVLGGKIIPKGYVNLTEMCKANGKRIAKYYEFSKTPAFLAELKAICGCPSKGHPEIVIEVSGNTQQGTWGALPVAVNLAQWISPKFSAWSSVVLAAVIKGDFVALTAEAEVAQAKLRESWERIRAVGIQTRRSLTDSIQEWYAQNPGGTRCPQHAMFSRVTDAIYQALWEMDAKGLELVLGCGRHEARDFMDEKSLQALERAESRVMEFIDEDNIKPIDAVGIAHIRRAKAAPTLR